MLARYFLLTVGTGHRHLLLDKLRSMRITEPEPPFLCPPCAQRLRSSLRYCDGDRHALPPECPDHQLLINDN